MSGSTRIVLVGLLASSAMPAFAAAPAAQETSFFGELLSIMVPLAFIILGLFAVLRFARRRYGLTGQDAPLSVAQIVPLGPRERIVLVKTRSGRTFVVGVAGQSVNLITELQPSDLDKPALRDGPDGINSA